MTAIPEGRDWIRMKRADFDDCAPLNLVDAAVCRPVPAVPDECGTQALFGKDPKPPRPRGPRTPAPAPAPTPTPTPTPTEDSESMDTLF